MGIFTDSLSGAGSDFMNGLRVLGSGDTWTGAAGDFKRGLGVVGDTYQNQGLGAAAGQVYGAAGDAFKTGAGVNDFQQTAQSMQNLGASPGLSRGVAAVGQSTADALNPLGFVGGAAAGGLAGDVLSTPAARNFISSTGGGVPLGGSTSPAAAASTSGGLRASSPIVQALESYKQPAPSQLGGGSNRLDTVMANTNMDLAFDAATMNAKSGGLGNAGLRGMVGRIKDSPGFTDAMTDVGPYSKYRGSGAQGLVLDSPGGQTVSRFQRGDPVSMRAQLADKTGATKVGQPPPPRLNMDEILQPIPGGDRTYGDIRLETLPNARIGVPGNPVDTAAARQLYDSGRAKGKIFEDLLGRNDNMGWVRNAEGVEVPKMVDPGFVRTDPRLASGAFPPPTSPNGPKFGSGSLDLGSWPSGGSDPMGQDGRQMVSSSQWGKSSPSPLASPGPLDMGNSPDPAQAQAILKRMLGGNK